MMEVLIVVLGFSLCVVLCLWFVDRLILWIVRTGNKSLESIAHVEAIDEGSVWSTIKGTLGVLDELVIRSSIKLADDLKSNETIDDVTVDSVEEFVNIDRDRIYEDKLRWVEQLLSDEQKDWVDVIIKGLDLESVPLFVKEGVLFGGDDFIESQLWFMDENKRVQKEVLAAKEDPEKVKGIIDLAMIRPSASCLSGGIMSTAGMAGLLGASQPGLQSGLYRSQAEAARDHAQQSQSHDPTGLMGILGIRL